MFSAAGGGEWRFERGRSGWSPGEAGGTLTKASTTDRSRRRDAEVRFEPRDVPAFLPLWLAAGLAAFIIIVLVGITLSFPLAVHQEYRGPLQPLPPQPRLQVSPHQDLAAYEAAKRRELRSHGSGIEAAMQATAREGWGPPR